MILKITLISTESEDFILEFKIDADSSFGDLHRLILKSCGYNEMDGQRFFICDENWKPQTRILLADEEAVDIDEDVFLMDDTDLGEFLEDERQHLTYRFDPENRRMFLMEVSEITFGEHIPAEGLLNRGHGKAPIQIAEEDTAPVASTNIITNEELAEEFYGEDGFNEDDLDEEGFDILNE